MPFSGKNSVENQADYQDRAKDLLQRQQFEQNLSLPTQKGFLSPAEGGQPNQPSQSLYFGNARAIRNTLDQESQAPAEPDAPGKPKSATTSQPAAKGELDEDKKRTPARPESRPASETTPDTSTEPPPPGEPSGEADPFAPAPDGGSGAPSAIRAGARRSLTIDFPAEGQSHHFRKLRDQATINLDFTLPDAKPRQWSLVLVFAIGAGLLTGYTWLRKRRN
jgi:hypothetical protein